VLGNSTNTPFPPCLGCNICSHRGEIHAPNIKELAEFLKGNPNIDPSFFAGKDVMRRCLLQGTRFFVSVRSDNSNTRKVAIKNPLILNSKSSTHLRSHLFAKLL